MKRLGSKVIVSFCILLAVFSLFLIGDNLLLIQEDKHFQRGNIGYGLECLDEIIDLFPGSSLVDDALYKAGNVLWKGADLEKIHTAVFSTLEGAGTLERIPISENSYYYWNKLIKEHPESPFAKKAKIKIGEMFYVAGDWEKVMDILSGDITNYGKDTVKAARLLSLTYLQTGQPRKVIELMEAVKESDIPYLPVTLKVLEGDARVQLGDYKGAAGLYRQAALLDDDMLKREKEYFKDFPGRQVWVERLKERQEMLACLQQDMVEREGPLKGEILLEGKGVPGVKVVALNYYEEGKSYYTFTDSRGRYLFSSLPEGVYEIVIQLPYKYVNGKYIGTDVSGLVLVKDENIEEIDFIINGAIDLNIENQEKEISLSWDEVPQAEYYRVYVAEVARTTA